MSQYVIKIISEEVRDIDGELITEEGQVFWLSKDEWGPLDSVEMDNRLLTFTGKEEADGFKSWAGLSSWCVPKTFEIVEVEPVTETVVKGYVPVQES